MCWSGRSRFSTARDSSAPCRAGAAPSIDCSRRSGPRRSPSRGSSTSPGPRRRRASGRTSSNGKPPSRGAGDGRREQRARLPSPVSRLPPCPPAPRRPSCCSCSRASRGNPASSRPSTPRSSSSPPIGPCSRASPTTRCSPWTTSRRARTSSSNRRDSGPGTPTRCTSWPSTGWKRGDSSGSWSSSTISSRSRPPSVRRPSLRRSAACSTSCAGATRATRSRRGGEVHPELEALLALQEKDQAVTATDAALAALAPELSTLDEAQAASERALAVARGGIQAAMDRRDELEGKIANYRSMQEQRRQRLEWVRGAKEASTLMAELDLARSVLAKEEAEFMRSGDAVTEAERRAAEAEKALQDVRAQQAPLREGLAGKRDGIAAQREAALAEREEAAARVSPAFLTRYERIRRGKAPLALYPLHGDACGHCFTAVPTQRRALIQRGATIEACEACGVLLYAGE